VTHIIRLLSLAGLLVLVGCAFSRTPSGPRAWPSVLKADSPPTPPRFIVSHFYEFETAVSQTQNLDIITIRESASIKNISGELATAINAEKTDAVGKATFDGTGMQPHELWVRGIAKKDNGLTGTELIGAVVTGLTLGALGLILPVPFPMHHGPRYTLRVEVSNAQGDIVATLDDEMKVDYTSLYLLGGVFIDYEADRRELFSRLAKAIVGLAKP
jgi:hypothetical protein